MKDKITREEVAKRMLNDWKFNRYNHGGSRSYIDGQSGDRQLMVDTYYDSTFAEYMDDCAKSYFAPTSGGTGMNEKKIIEILREYVTEVNDNGFDMMVIMEEDIENISEQISKI